EHEVGGKPSTCEQGKRDGGPEESSNSEPGIEQADARVAKVEQVERYHDDEHVEGAADEGLDRVEAHQGSQVGIAENRSEARACAVGDALTRGRRRSRLLQPDAGNEQRRPEKDAGRREKDNLCARQGEEQAA